MDSSKLYLVHHGIKGQRWGVRRFQNKDGSLTSAGQKRYDIKKASKRTKPTVEESEQDAERKRRIKKAIKIGIGVIVGLLAAYGAYKYVQSRGPIELNPNVNLDSQLIRKKFESTDFDKAINDDLRKINREGWAGHLLLRDREVNCTSCSMAYEMRRRGYDVVAAKRPLRGRNCEEMERFFQGGTFQELAKGWEDENNKRSLVDHVSLYKYAEKELLEQGEGARGIINGFYNHGGGHSIAYEIHNGRVHFVDGQIGRQYKDAREAIGDMYRFYYLQTDKLALTNQAAETVLNNTKASLLSERPSDLAISLASITGLTAANVAMDKEIDKELDKRSKSKSKRKPIFGR